jgi:thymidine kinase
MTKNELNSEQKRLKLELLFWICNNNNGYFGILGAGGTGKTFTICNVLSEIEDTKVIFLGATNKVVTVLKDSLISNGMTNPTCKTIDSFLGFRIVKDHENKSNITYRLPSKKDIPDILVIDECSMITFQKIEQIEKLSEKCKIILLGDHLQLPPIEEEKSNVETVFMSRNK